MMNSIKTLTWSNSSHPRRNRPWVPFRIASALVLFVWLVSQWMESYMYDVSSLHDIPTPLGSKVDVLDSPNSELTVAKNVSTQATKRISNPRSREPKTKKKRGIWLNCTWFDFPGIELIEVANPDPSVVQNKRQRIYCFLMTHSKRQRKTAAVWDTWGPKCDYLLLASNVTDPKWNAVQMTSQPTYENLWNKLNETLHYISNTTHHFQDYDWYFKVDDDSFVVLENLQAFLASDPVQEKAQQQLPLIYGRNFAYPEYRTLRSMDTFFGKNSLVNRDFKRRFFQKFNGSERLVYPSGGAGYVMNPTFVRTFVATLNGPDTLRGIPDEDMAVGVNMLYQGVRPEPSRDEHGLQLFHPELPPVMYNLPNGTADWLVDNHKTIGGIQAGKNCCSPYSISFHHARTPMIMRHMQYQIYHCRKQRKRKENKANHGSLLWS